MNPEKQVYDEHEDQDSQPVTRPNLRALEGDGQTSEPKKGHLSSVGSSGSPAGPSLFNPKGDSDKNTTDGDVSKTGNLQSLESVGLPGEKLGSGYNASAGSTSRFEQAKILVAGNKKKLFIGGGITGIFAALFIIFLFVLIPLKIESIVTDLQNRFFGVATNAVQGETDNIFSHYFTDDIGSALSNKNNHCAHEGGYVISKDCTINVNGSSNNPVVNLYKAWTQANLENTLSTKYGIELRYVEGEHGGTYYLKAPGIEGEKYLGEGTSDLNKEFVAADRGTVRTTFHSVEEDMTLWDKVLFRYKIGRLLEEKYGIKRCIVFCGTQDALSDAASNDKYAAKLFLIDRVISPHNAALGSVLTCIFNNQCNSGQKKTTPTCAEAPDCDEIPEPTQGVIEGEAEAAEGVVAQSFADETASKLVGVIGDVREAGGINNYIYKKILTTLGLDDLASGVFGDANLLSMLSSALSVAKNAGPDSKMFSYAVNAGAAVSLYEMYNTYADEIHTGHVNATEVGSFTDSLGSGSQCDALEKNTCTVKSQLGGTASAEDTPLYNNLINNTYTPSTSTSLLNEFMPGNADAASSNPNDGFSDYKCNNGSPVPADSLVCPEENFSAGSSSLESISSSLNSGVIGDITGAVSVLSSPFHLLGDLTSALTSFITSNLHLSLPGFITNAVTPFMKSIVNDLIPDPFSQDMSGGRTFDLMAGGADVAGADYAHYGLGGKEVSATQAADISASQENQAHQAFMQESFFARMFNTNSQYSLISKLALDMPSNLESSTENDFASYISDPLSAVGDSLASLFSDKVSAASTSGVVNGQDVFGVPQYEPDIESDPESYWDANCNNNPADGYQDSNQWMSSATEDPNTGGSYNNTTDPCLTIEQTVGSDGAIFDQTLLTQDEQADIGGTSSNSSGDTTTPSTPVATGITGNGTGNFTTDTSHAPYPGLDAMLARVKAASTPAGAIAFCASLHLGTGCHGDCESAVEVAWLGHRGVYLFPFGSAGNTPAAGSSWAAALATGHAHPGNRNPPVGAVLIYNRHVPGDVGHTTIYLGNNLVFSTDFNFLGSADGGVGIQPASAIESGAWANSYVGWMDPYYDGQVGT